MALEIDKEDLKYIKSTIVWMLENMQLKSTERIYTEDLHNLSMNSINALERGLELGFNEAKAALPLHGVKHFKFFSSHTPNELIKEIDTDMQAPIKGNYVWLNGGVRFQVTAVHYDYEKHIIKIYCA